MIGFIPKGIPDAIKIGSLSGNPTENATEQAISGGLPIPSITGGAAAPSAASSGSGQVSHSISRGLTPITAIILISGGLLAWKLLKK